MAAAPTFSVSNVTLAEGTGGVTNATVTITGTAGDYSVPFNITYTVTAGTATAGVNFTASAGTKNFPGAGTSDIVIPIVTDSIFEPDETVIVTLTGGGTFTTAVATVTIQNDDAAPAGSVRPFPTPRDDYNIATTEAGDTIVAMAGDDYVDGDRGRDSLNGDEGNDSVYGGADDDTVAGGVGNDLLFGDDGDDSMSGDSGTDTLTGG